MTSLRDAERKLEELRTENEVATEQVSLSQKKALIKEAKEKYGRDYKKVLGLAKHVKLNKESMLTLHGMGVGNERLKDLSDPGRSRISRYN